MKSVLLKGLSKMELVATEELGPRRSQPGWNVTF